MMEGDQPHALVEARAVQRVRVDAKHRGTLELWDTWQQKQMLENSFMGL